MVAQERVTRLLQPWLGAAFLQRCDLAQQAADTLHGCDIAKRPSRCRRRIWMKCSFIPCAI